jgi:PhnB protein
VRLDIYVNYRGNCEEAFRFYETHLGGRVTSIVRHEGALNPNLPPEWAGKILHARMDLGSTTLMGADIPNAEPMRTAYLTLSPDGVDDAERIYEGLTAGGEVFMKMSETPFAKRFAMLRDRFGASWMILYQASADASAD